MAFLSKNFHTSAEVWSKYGTWKGAWIAVLPYLPYLPYLAPPACIRAGARACARACMRMCVFSMEGMEVWKNVVFKGSPTSTPVPYLN